MTPLQIDSRILSNKKIAKNYYLLSLEAPSGFKDAVPGQFVHIRINDFSEPLLRRPFSIHRLIQNKSKPRFSLDILYELKGRGTQSLSKKQPDEYLNILGPLGRGFGYQLKDAKDQTHIIIAGGAGVAPLFFLAEKLAQAIRLRPSGFGGCPAKLQMKAGKIIVLIGAATDSKILCEKDFKDLGCEVNIATEDGSRGFKGRVTAMFERKIASIMDVSSRLKAKSNAINVYACGPEAMLTVLAKICLIKKLPLQVSKEEFMGCGIGACLGCAVETKQGFKRACYDGPVFLAKDIVWGF